MVAGKHDLFFTNIEHGIARSMAGNKKGFEGIASCLDFVAVIDRIKTGIGFRHFFRYCRISAMYFFKEIKREPFVDKSLVKDLRIFLQLEPFQNPHIHIAHIDPAVRTGK